MAPLVSTIASRVVSHGRLLCIWTQSALRSCSTGTDNTLIACVDDIMKEPVKFDLDNFETGFVFERNGILHAYKNECSHMSLELDMEDADFFTNDMRYIQCKVHGALFTPESGACARGQCNNVPLTRLPINVTDDGNVWLLPVPEGDAEAEAAIAAAGGVVVDASRAKAHAEERSRASTAEMEANMTADTSPPRNTPSTPGGLRVELDRVQQGYDQILLDNARRSSSQAAPQASTHINILTSSSGTTGMGDSTTSSGPGAAKGETTEAGVSSGPTGAGGKGGVLSSTPAPVLRLSVGLRPDPASGDIKRTTVEARVGETLLEALNTNPVVDIEATCGGECACATCHVVLSQPLTAMETAAGRGAAEEEDDLLDTVLMQPTSRLACQMVVREEWADLVGVTAVTSAGSSSGGGGGDGRADEGAPDSSPVLIQLPEEEY